MLYSAAQRRHALQNFAKYTLYFGLGSAAVLTSRKSQAQVPLTPGCGTKTPAQLEGPFFTPGSPERSKLIGAREKAQKIQLSGEVVDSSCRSVTGALLDFWQCDEKGQYDTKGFSLRGHQYSNSKGEFFLETLLPGSYPGRTSHLHVKVQRKGGQVLTTQLYLPNHAGNAQDFLFDPSLSLVSQGQDFRWQFVLPNLT
jgi:protocatechuate 3,4-dioxygenase beta subunit